MRGLTVRQLIGVAVVIGLGIGLMTSVFLDAEAVAIGFVGLLIAVLFAAVLQLRRRLAEMRDRLGKGMQQLRADIAQVRSEIRRIQSDGAAAAQRDEALLSSLHDLRENIQRAGAQRHPPGLRRGLPSALARRFGTELNEGSRGSGGDSGTRRAIRRLIPKHSLVRDAAGWGPGRPARRTRERLLRVPPPVGSVRMGDLYRLTPVSRRWGFERGTPIDRYYIEDFLRRQRGYGKSAVSGHVLEVGGSEYARQFGGWTEASSSVSQLDILHATTGNPQATIIGDLATGDGLSPDTYDCIICTQTIHVIYDASAAIGTLHRILRPGGVAFVTAPGISQVCRPDRDLWGDYWRFTSLSLRRLFEQHFSPAAVTVEAYGNVLAASAFLYGLATEDLPSEILETRDPDYELLLAVRAQR